MKLFQRVRDSVTNLSAIVQRFNENSVWLVLYGVRRKLPKERIRMNGKSISAACRCGPFWSPACPNQEHRHRAWLEFRSGIKPSPSLRKEMGRYIDRSWEFVSDEDYQERPN